MNCTVKSFEELSKSFGELSKSLILLIAPMHSRFGIQLPCNSAGRVDLSAIGLAPLPAMPQDDSIKDKYLLLQTSSTMFH